MLTLLACIVVADFITGLVHWWEDSYGLPTWPILGKQVILPNIDHHERPGLMGHMTTFYYRNYQTLVPAMVVAVGTWAWSGSAAWPVALTLVLAALGNEVHTWCHRKHNHWLIRFAQDAGLIQSPQQHAKHHRGSFDRYYCTLTNFTNAVLELVQFSRGLEWLVRAVSGLEHRRCSAARRGF